MPVQEVVTRLNRMLVGWANYLRLAPVSSAYRAIECDKHKVRGAGTTRYPNEYLYQELGLAQLAVRTRNSP